MIRLQCRNEGTFLRTGKRRVEMEKKKAPVKKAKKKKKVLEKSWAKTDENKSRMGEEAGGGTGSGMDEGQTDDEAEDEERESVVSTVTGNIDSSSSSCHHFYFFIECLKCLKIFVFCVQVCLREAVRSQRKCMLTARELF